jgi:hypothetical protein
MVSDQNPVNRRWKTMQVNWLNEWLTPRKMMYLLLGLVIFAAIALFLGLFGGS